MKFEIEITKKHLYILLALILIAPVFAAVVSHTAEQIRAGVFGQIYTGNWSFMNGSVGIGTTNPSHKLNVVGDANITGTLHVGSGTTVITASQVTADDFICSGGNCIGGAEINEGSLSCTAITGGSGLCDGTDAYNSAFDTEAEVETAVANDVSTGYIPRDNGNKFQNSPIYATSSTGNVGIGTQIAIAKLSVYGSGIAAYILNTASGAGLIVSSDTTGKLFSVENTGGNRFRFIVKGNGKVGIGRTPVTNDLEVQGTASKTTSGDWLANSDRRIKTDIHDIDNALDTISRLSPVKFKYTDEYKQLHPSVEDKYYYNFIAQEYQEVFPESVKGSGEYLEGDDKEILQMDSYNAQIVAIKAIQELKSENEEQQQEIDLLKSELCLKDNTYSWC